MTSRQPALPGCPTEIIGIDELRDPNFVAVRRVAEDVLGGAVDHDRINTLALRALEALAPESDGAEARVEELVESWRTALEYGQKPARYLLDACPGWVLDELGVKREKAA